MKLSTKLIGSFTFVIALLLIIGMASHYVNNRVKNRVIEESRGAVKKLELLGEVESYLYQSLINAQYYLNEPYRKTLESTPGDSTNRVEKIKAKLSSSLKKFNRSLNEMSSVLKKENAQQANPQNISFSTLKELESRVDSYNLLMKQLLNYDENKYQDEKELLTVTIEPFFRNNLLPLVESFRDQVRTNMEQEVTQLNNRLSTYSNILFFATIMAFILSIILAYILYKSITTPLYSLAMAAQDIGKGNLEKRIEIATNDEIGQLGASFNRMAENLNKITFSKDYVDNIIESMRDALIVADEHMYIQKINTSAENLLGYDQGQLIGQPLAIILADHSQIILSLEEYALIENFETHFSQKSGGKVPVSLSKAVIHNSDGHIQGLVCVASDITERKESERMIKQSLKEKEILLAEIHHRVKNNLAVISGLLQMQIWEAENDAVEQVLQDSQLRVKSIALVHEKLYQSENLSSIVFDKYVGELIKGIQSTYRREATHINFETDMAPITLNINQAIPCSLLLNELIVNIYKHAFKHGEEGHVQIKLWKKNKKVHLMVKDDGVGLNEDFGTDSSEKSLGFSLVNTLVKQLNGTIEAYTDEGATFNIIFDLEAVN